MIKTTKMHLLGSYNYYGVTEAAYRVGDRYYISIIDHRKTDTKLDGIYDDLGVRPVPRAYITKWAADRGIIV